MIKDYKTFFEGLTEFKTEDDIPDLPKLPSVSTWFRSITDAELFLRKI